MELYMPADYANFITPEHCTLCAIYIRERNTDICPNSHTVLHLSHIMGLGMSFTSPDGKFKVIVTNLVADCQFAVLNVVMY